ncbi:E3 ubiquitin-protein ligase RNF186 [Spea bombifrons]|uniref:E3 ubiquitin-protein ligase RNF186 n=1 Tax=Spea bombifrons TaxID=233779 RepID=UPI0023498EBD|nr:E3 ubiquitin-protein ligase RNF186 [Spea bombifrons]
MRDHSASERQESSISEEDPMDPLRDSGGSAGCGCDSTEVDSEVPEQSEAKATTENHPKTTEAETDPALSPEPTLHSPHTAHADLPPCAAGQDLPSCGASPLTDIDCPVCFCKYDIHRIPKKLACGHNFCAVCLKLLVRHEHGSWVIICPICRASTAVFGGLVCTLENQESLLSRLEDPDAKGEAPEPRQRPNTADIKEESPGSLRGVARRVLSLCLILLILLIIILQFVYTGIMKWVLGFILGVVVIIAILLCFNPSCSSQADATQKDNSVISTV